MACYFIPIPCASSGTKRRTHRTEERQQTRPNALCRQRYYRTWRPVLPLGGTNAKCYRQQQKVPELPKYSLSLAVLPAPDPVLPGCGTTAPCYRHQQKAPAQVPGRQAVLPARKRYYRMTGTTGRAGPVLPDLEKPERNISAQRLVTLSIFRYLFPKYPCLCGWPIYSPHPPL